MKFFHDILMAIQWVAFLGGLGGAVPLAVYTSPVLGFLALIVSLIALVALKLEVVAFAR